MSYIFQKCLIKLLLSIVHEKHHEEKESVLADYKKRKILEKLYNGTSQWGKKKSWSLNVPSIINQIQHKGQFKKKKKKEGGEALGKNRRKKLILQRKRKEIIYLQSVKLNLLQNWSYLSRLGNTLQQLLIKSSECTTDHVYVPYNEKKRGEKN